MIDGWHAGIFMAERFLQCGFSAHLLLGIGLLLLIWSLYLSRRPNPALRIAAFIVAATIPALLGVAAAAFRLFYLVEVTKQSAATMVQWLIYGTCEMLLVTTFGLYETCIFWTVGIFLILRCSYDNG